MKYTKSLKLAFNILRHSKLRSWLSIIGIVIGVASVIAIMALGEGMQQSIEERLGSLGADIITVSPGHSRASGAGASFRGPGMERGEDSLSSAKNITNKDVQALKLVSNVDLIQGIVSARGEMTYLSETASISVTGVDTKVWKNIETSDINSGRFLSQGDKNVVVIGSRLAERFKDDIQLNRQITIEGKVFRVVGILDGGSNVYMPIETARVVLEDVGDKKFDSIQIKIKDVDIIDETLEQIEKRLMLVRAVNERTKDFSVSSVKEMQETISESISSMTLFLEAIAAISLLVGAVGIANTMFTTVLEKTKEIGIMKSIGSKNKDILLIFLFNSAMIGLAGGILGSILGIGLSQVLMSLISGLGNNGGFRMIGGSSAVIDPLTILGVAGISILIGIIAGVVPAYKASKMNPVDAIRYE